MKKMSGTLGAAECEDESRRSENSSHFFPHVVVRRAMIPLDVLDWLDGVSILHVCDAFQATQHHRKLHRFTWDAGQLADPDNLDESGVRSALKSLRGQGSHDFGLPDVLRLAEKTGVLPKQVIIWAIEGNCFQPEDVISDETRETALQAVNEIAAELSVPHA
ncbi:MAG: hypothetical protein H7Z17_12245 [Fuerstia sp.]|nr:hypothetical protein [Fuerstiella sp.]